MRLRLDFGVACLSIGCSVPALMAQTSVDLTTQGRLRVGTQLSQSCTAGQMFLVAGNTGPATLYVCSPGGIWSAAGLPSAGIGIAMTGGIVSVEDAVVPTYYTGTGTPAIDCLTGRDYYVDTAAGALYFCKASGQWQQISTIDHTHTADSLTSGTLPMSVLPSGLATLSAANTFAADQRQSMTHGPTNAGLRLAPASGDPSTVQDGDLWYNVTTNKFRRRQNGSTMDWDAATGVSLTQPNSYTAGQRQSMGHDATNAGLRLIPAGGDPSTVQDGDLWYNATTNKFRRRQNGASSDWDAAQGGSAFNPFDRSTFWMVEEFLPSGNYPAGTNLVGTHRWGLDNVTGGTSGCAQVAESNGNTNWPGTLSLIITGGAGNGCAVALDQSNNTMLTTNWSTTVWEAHWTFLPDIAAANFTARFGMGQTAYTPASISAVECRIDPSVSSHYLFDLYTNGVQTASVDSGVTFSVDGREHTCRVRGDGSKWYFSVASGNNAFSTEKTLCPAGCDMTAALATFAMTPFASLVANDAGTKRFYIDRFAVMATGLTR
jgi:hypothetical protein